MKKLSVVPPKVGLDDKLQRLSSRLDQSGDMVRGLRVEEILKSKESVLSIHEVCEQRSLFYGSVLNFLMRSGDSKPCFFLDFDIVHAYLTGGVAGRASEAEINYFFQVSEVEYAIPIGTFNELMGFLERTGLYDLIAPLNSVIPNSECSLRQMVEKINSISGEQGGSRRIVEQAERLLDLLSSPRFRGVIKDYSPNVAKELEAVLNSDSAQRSGRYKVRQAERSQNDFNDSVNLAITVEQYLNDGISQVPDRWCVLMSSTTAIQRASRLLCNDVCGGNWLTVNPRVVIIADLLNFVEKKTNAKHLMRSIRDGWSRIEQRLSRRHDELEDQESGENEDLSGIAAAIEDDVSRLLVAEQIVRIERITCQLPSISYLQLRQIAASSNELRSSESQNDCFRVLDALRGSLASLDPGNTYEIVHLESDMENRTLGIRSGDKSFGRDWFLTMQFLSSNMLNHGFWARWEICCSDDRFASALEESKAFFPITSDNNQFREPEIVDEQMIKKTAELSGVIASNSLVGVFFPVSWVHLNGGWNRITLPVLFRSISENARQRRLSDERWLDTGELIQEITIRLGKVQIVYEVVPKNEKANRSISIYCPAVDDNCSKLIALMYDWTGMRFTHKQILERTIAQACKDFVSSASDNPSLKE